MSGRLSSLALALTIAGCGAHAVAPASSTLAFDDPLVVPMDASAKLLFDDEFDGTKLDEKVWYWCYPDVSGDRGCSNNPGLELEWYQRANVTVGGGYLSLTAKHQTVKKGYPYTSGMVSTGGTSQTAPTFSYLYGYAEARMKLPRGAGMWPAFWIVPANGSWPPEIDFLEWQGVAPRDDIVTVHWGKAANPQQSQRVYDTGVDLWKDYHVYACDWEPNYVRWYFDGRPIATYAGAAGIPRLPMYVILNLAVGGWFKGQLDPAPSSFPATMSVDYVRIWNKNPY